MSWIKNHNQNDSNLILLDIINELGVLLSNGEDSIPYQRNKNCLKLMIVKKIWPFGKNVHVEILSSMPATIGSYQQ